MQGYDPGPGTADAMTPDQRRQYGEDWFNYVMTFPAPAIDSPFRKAGIANFVFGEMWSRPGISLKERRWITLACVAASDAESPVRTHVYAALKSGDITYPEIMEGVLHIAVYLGWPKASFLEQTVRDCWAQIEKEGGTVKMAVPEIPGASLA